eukprot:TRINITY_DN63418_c0_g1_i1.p1 TRINITY_DN63418_c0_g1~~TRINITY_DN63418_c0_g1_i1.p1  ORF type:complete len:582 (-),score=84.28 TRINITY_DN63418_c0_g1_i1:70-1779(-)
MDSWRDYVCARGGSIGRVMHGDGSIGCGPRSGNPDISVSSADAADDAAATTTTGCEGDDTPKCQWMWGDTGALPLLPVTSLAEFNTFRWSSLKEPLEIAAELDLVQGSRPVNVYVSGQMRSTKFLGARFAAEWLRNMNQRDAVTKSLASRGFTVRQILDFYTKFKGNGKITKDTTTADVVRDIIIPETADERCCYMHGQVRMLGGTHPPKKFVSHWWGNRFRDSVMAIVQDATQMGLADLANLVDHGIKRERLPVECLDESYWMCAFAVNQHTSVCGSESFPCACGSPKHLPGHTLCEVDKADVLVAQIRELIVVIDPALQTFRRAWVLSEMWRAIALSRRIAYRLPSRIAEEFRSGDCEVLRICDCETSLADDMKMILDRVDADIGQVTFNKLMFKEITRSVLNLALASEVVWAGDDGVAVVRQLLEKRANPNALGESGRPVLTLAVLKGHLQIVQVLLGARASIECRDDDGFRTPLLHAAHQNRTEAVRALVNAKANTEAGDVDGRTALMWAAYYGEPQAARALLEARACIEARSGDGNTALAWASRLGRTQVIDLLKKFGATGGKM